MFLSLSCLVCKEDRIIITVVIIIIPLKIVLKMSDHKTKPIVYYPTDNKYLINIGYIMGTIKEGTKGSQTQEFYQIIDSKMVFRKSHVFLPRFRASDVFLTPDKSKALSQCFTSSIK